MGVQRRERGFLLLPALAAAALAAILLLPLPASAEDPYAAEPDPRFAAWAAAERPAQQFRRTRLELTNFLHRCSWMADDWDRNVVARHASLDRVIVIDSRHGRWSGIGDSLIMWMSQMRFARALGRAGFIFLDACADPQAPERMLKSDRSEGAECRFDAGAYFRGFGPNVDWQWSEATRRRVEQRHGPRATAELLLGTRCSGELGQRCEILYDNGTVAASFEMNDSRDGPKTKEDQLAYFRRAGGGERRTNPAFSIIAVRRTVRETRRRLSHSQSLAQVFQRDGGGAPVDPGGVHLEPRLPHRRAEPRRVPRCGLCGGAGGDKRGAGGDIHFS